MSTDSTQVMRVLDRCLDTAPPSSDTLPGVAAAATFARADPDLHKAIAQLLDARDETFSVECLRAAMAAVREAESGNLADIERREKPSPFTRIFKSCATASRAVSGADPRTTAILTETLLAAVILEMSSLGASRSRELRNHTAHSDVAAARVLSRRLADSPPEAGR